MHYTMGEELRRKIQERDDRRIRLARLGVVVGEFFVVFGLVGLVVMCHSMQII
jgi:hypothetical protein